MGCSYIIGRFKVEVCPFTYFCYNGVMKSLFTDTRILDAACREQYGLTEEIMMENAAAALEEAVMKSAGKMPASSVRVLVLCGSGNNGADGYALLRRLAGKIAVWALVAAAGKSPLCQKQAERARRLGVPLVDAADAGNAGFEATADADSSFPCSGGLIVVDCIFGSGFHGELPSGVKKLLAQVELAARSAEQAFFIACDVPTGLCQDGGVAAGSFRADLTVTMGAEKLCLYSDAAKDLTGKILVADLGLSRPVFEGSLPLDKGGAPAAYRLEKEDLRLPVRTRQNSHKGLFGHVAVVSGEKGGAACIAGEAALHFGAGLVTLVRFPRAEAVYGPLSRQALSPELMWAGDFPQKTGAVALGMGLGRALALSADAAAGSNAVAAASFAGAESYFRWLLDHPAIPAVIDADALYEKSLSQLLQRRPQGLVLTPHAKEFAALLENCLDAGAFSSLPLEGILQQRPALMAAFCRTYPGVVLLVKGANVMIGVCPAADSSSSVGQAADSQLQLYVNPYGSPALSKAGSGDVLSGLIAALLAQGYRPLDAAISGSLAHALASRKVEGSYSLTPRTLIEKVACLEADFRQC